MEQNVYFNGASYGRIPATREFGAVRPSGFGALPYVTLNPEGIEGASHHSSVYRLSEDGQTAYLVKQNPFVESPGVVDLRFTTIGRDLRQAVEKAVENSIWH